MNYKKIEDVDKVENILEHRKKNIMMGSAFILTNGSLEHADAKTAHGLIRGTERFDIKGVIDYNSAGRDAGEVLDGMYRNIPVYATVDAYIKAAGTKPDYAIIGVALSGGRLNEQWQALALDILKLGISIVNGMHMLLGDHPVFREVAKTHNAEIIDIRRHKPFDQLHFWSGRIFQMKVPRLAILGMDCALGKRTTSRMIIETCLANKIHAEMIYTGQTGWLQGNLHGFILDTTINDFVSGEIETAIIECEQESSPDIILIEGQSSLRNPLGPCGSEIIVSGNVKGVILQHTPFRKFYAATEDIGCLLPDVADEIRLIEMYKTKVLAVTLNGTGGSKQDLEQYRQTLEARLNIPVILPLEDGLSNLLPVIRQFIKNHDKVHSAKRLEPGIARD
ncbi:MAG: DUF1611 domain-containing protein [Desulfobacula sp.]|uniref:DUF1611 domain-containing protein n=1 Tax=Desulfobacula sp. TaxID=2593537 RepID=UPI0025BE919D|nr:DUF1611 domain-containing protein [Desulfobacula sp.]MCD4721314.1 DUF1611 domain-containing protein [Desulfobacula sp.]